MSLDPDSGQTIISGMGELHLDIYVERLKREYKVEATVGKPQVRIGLIFAGSRENTGLGVQKVRDSRPQTFKRGDVAKVSFANIYGMFRYLRRSPQAMSTRWRPQVRSGSRKREDTL